MEIGTIVATIHQYLPEEVIAFHALRTSILPAAKRLFEHWKHDSPAIQEKAIDNAADLSRRVNVKVQALIDAGVISVEQIEVAVEEPSFSQMLGRAFTDASETPDDFKHDQLASLLAQRLAAPDGSFRANTIRMAVEKLPYLDRRQLLLLGLTYVVQHVSWTPHPGTFKKPPEELLASYMKALNVAVAPYAGIEPNFRDLLHMESLALVRTTPRISGSAVLETGGERIALLGPLDTFFYGHLKPIGQIEPPDELRKLLRRIHGTKTEIGLENVSVLPAGYVLGMAVASHFSNEPMDLSEFNEPRGVSAASS